MNPTRLSGMLALFVSAPELVYRAHSDRGCLQRNRTGRGALPVPREVHARRTARAADLGWHGLDGDRRLAFRRLEDRGGFPWLTASKLPELILFTPHRGSRCMETSRRTFARRKASAARVRGSWRGGRSPLRVTGRDDAAQPWHLRRSEHLRDRLDTVREIGRLAGQSPDVRRFRPNIVVRPLRAVPFEEDEWVGGVLSFGEGTTPPPSPSHARHALRDGEPRSRLGSPRPRC